MSTTVQTGSPSSNPRATVAALYATYLQSDMGAEATHALTTALLAMLQTGEISVDDLPIPLGVIAPGLLDLDAVASAIEIYIADFLREIRKIFQEVFQGASDAEFQHFMAGMAHAFAGYQDMKDAASDRQESSWFRAGFSFAQGVIGVGMAGWSGVHSWRGGKSGVGAAEASKKSLTRRVQGEQRIKNYNDEIKSIQTTAAGQPGGLMTPAQQARVRDLHQKINDERTQMDLDCQSYDMEAAKLDNESKTKAANANTITTGSNATTTGTGAGGEVGGGMMTYDAEINDADANLNRTETEGEQHLGQSSGDLASTAKQSSQGATDLDRQLTNDRNSAIQSELN